MAFKGNVGTSMQVHSIQKKRGKYKVFACLIPGCKDDGVVWGYCSPHFNGDKR